jgi:hypothetical protein
MCCQQGGQAMKKVAILQSNYIPWKGYFDLIASVDEFILYDDVQFTKNDWRNRNKIKTPRGVEWLSIPVGKHISGRIRDIELPDNDWREKHWAKLEDNYRESPHFEEIADLLRLVYLKRQQTHLSGFNRELIEWVCRYLGITTKISNSWDYTLIEGKAARLADLCIQAGGAEYVSGPAAKDYIEEGFFSERNIKLTWFNYDGYPEYPQLWGSFVHEVTILDLLFNCGKDAPQYMRYIKK